jgi:TIR domain
MKTSTNPQVVFISYRHSDSDALAGRLRDRMQLALPDWTFFMDVASIQPGVDFRVAIAKALRRTSIFLLLIGRDLLGDDANRLLQPSDPISYEIKLALDLGIRFIPVLINDAKMAAPEEFPEEIRPVSRLIGVELRHSRFEDDFRNLVSVISGGGSPAAVAAGQKVLFRRLSAVVIGASLAIAVVLFGLVINFQMTGTAASDWIGDYGAALLLPAVAIIGGAAGLFLSARK